MQLRICMGLITLVFASVLVASAAAGQQPSVRNMDWGYPMGSAYGSPAIYAQGWSGNPYFGGNVYQPYNYSPHLPYLYFYEQYAREAEDSRRAADEYEASLAREGKLTGPLEVGAFKTDSLPRSPLKLQLTLDGQAVTPSPSGAPLVIESGEHLLRVGNGQTSADH